MKPERAGRWTYIEPAHVEPTESAVWCPYAGALCLYPILCPCDAEVVPAPKGDLGAKASSTA